MAKFNTSNARAAVGSSAITTTSTAAFNHNGGIGALRDPKSELFLTLVSEFGGEQTFYEDSKTRLARIDSLTREVALADPEWITGLTGWLRSEGNMRTASIIVAMTAAKALVDAKVPGVRKLVAAAIQRADEPGEALAYWFSQYGRKLPIGVKRGIADGAVKTFSEYSLGKYDGGSNDGFSFSDVIQLVHPEPKDERQSALFKFAMDRRYNSDASAPETLPMLQKRAEILGLPVEEKRKLILSSDATERLKEAGLTWEAIGSSFGKGGLDAKAWEAVIPTMGYMALLRNLRNFEDADVSDSVLDAVAARIADPEEVAKSRQLPFRFLSAYNNVRGLRFAYPLEKALNHSLANVPKVKGRTLILVDRSGSMFGFGYSQKSEMTWADSAALFGTALALRSEKADLIQFGTNWGRVDVHRNASVLKAVQSFASLGGTNTAAALRATFDEHDRVVILTDDQHSGPSPYSVIPESVPIYTWNFAGYRYGGGVTSRNRVYMGGLTASSFSTINLVEAGHNAKWPWEG